MYTYKLFIIAVNVKVRIAICDGNWGQRISASELNNKKISTSKVFDNIIDDLLTQCGRFSRRESSDDEVQRLFTRRQSVTLRRSAKQTVTHADKGKNGAMKNNK